MLRRLTGLGYKKMWSTWIIPLILSPNHDREGLQFAKPLRFGSNNIDQIITDKEVWILRNYYRKKSQDAVPRSRVSRFDLKFFRVLQERSLEMDQTLISDAYVHKLTHLGDKKTAKSFGSLLMLGNARKHMTNHTKTVFLP